MNQDQRKYLIDVVKSSYDRQCKEIRANMPVKPSLNNYLVAACLDGSIQLQDVDGLKSKIRERVIKYGKDDRLVKESDTWGRSVDRNVTIPAEDIFVFPQAYNDALKEYEERLREINNKISLLESQKDTIIMKIQIGSAGHLQKLVMEVDNMADLSLVNSTLTLSAGTSGHELEEEAQSTKRNKKIKSS